MNFFGHAAVATWAGGDPAHCLGAMLPDFASMAATRLVAVDRADLRGGVEHHHAVDALFHRLPRVRRWMRETTAAMARRGVGRGPSLGAGHVGVELLLDGMLLDDAGARARYQAAIAHAGDAEIDDALRWHEDGRARWHAVRARLGTLDLLERYRSADAVADILERILGRRPRLRTRPGDRARMASALREVRGAIQYELPALKADLRAGAPRCRSASSTSPR